MTKIVPIPVLKDNYVWTLIDNKNAVIVDPGEAAPVIDFIHKNQLSLKGILITHHHWDHTNGMPELKKRYQVPVYAPASENIAETTVAVHENDVVSIEGFPVQLNVISIPCHTSGHIAYYAPGILFSGDTLFAAGCGRLFEGDAKQMYASLKKLAALPDDTKIYCGHEYTLNNLRFAETVEPGNLKIAERKQRVSALREKNIASLPSTLAEEKETNPFLRCEVSEVASQVQKHAGKKLNNAIDVFAELRLWKDHF